MTEPTDKIEHGYLPMYRAIAADLGPDARVCEVGIAAGAGLRMFRELFPGGMLVGVDQRESCRHTCAELAHIVIADQDHPALAAMLRKSFGFFDLVVDDASHDGRLTAMTYAQLWPMVRPGGYYVIEDWYVGFPSWPSYDDSMLDLARGFLDFLERKPEAGGVESVTYEYGLIIIRKSPS